MDMGNVNTTRVMKINSSAAVLQAAIEGHGVALARSVMVQSDVQSERLIRLFPEMQMHSPFSYFVVYRHEFTNLPKVRLFLNWLLEKV